MQPVIHLAVHIPIHFSRKQIRVQMPDVLNAFRKLENMVNVCIHEGWKLCVGISVSFGSMA